MSTKSTILLTDDNEHWYFDCMDCPDSIILEFNKDNIEFHDDDISITVEIMPGTDLYKQAHRSLLKGAWFNNNWK